MWNAWFDRNGVFAEFDALTREMAGARSRELPETQRMDVREDPKSYVLTADLPGVAPEAVALDVHDGVLTLKAERSADGPKGYEARHRERRPWRVTRSFALPDGVDAANISAKFEHGRLAVTLPKLPAREPRRIAING